MKNIGIKIGLLTATLLLLLTLGGCDGEECSHTHMTATTVEPTHEKQGRTVYYCNDCEYEYESDFVPPLGHMLKHETHAPTCTEQGYVYNYCDCGYHYNSDYVSPLGHTLSVEEVAPTCNTEGYKIGDCSVCKEHYTFDIVAPLGHDLKIDRKYVSLSNEMGESHYTCGRCDLDYHGSYTFYHDIYKGAYVENTEVLCKGVDVSYHQHDQIKEDKTYIPLNWVKIKEQGYDFAILRAGYMGLENVFVEDPVFDLNYTDAKAAGLGVGAYIYSYAYSVEEAKAEAEAMLKVLEGKQFEYPIFFDIEYSDKKIAEKGLTPEMLTDICLEFITTMQNGGYFTALYTSNKWLTEHLVPDRIVKTLDIWYARYLYDADSGKVVNEAQWNFEKYGDQMAMWQFSETGTIEGIVRNFEKNEDGTPKDVNFDLNYCYKDYPTLIKHYGLNGFPAERDLLHLA